MPSSVAIAYHENTGRAIFDALHRLDNLSELFEDKYVAIKPNDTWASPRDLTPCTQADSVRAVIQYVKRYRPRGIIVTGGSGDEETDNVFRYLGIDKVTEEEGVEFVDHNRPPFTPVALEYGPHKEVMVNQRVLEYDTLISLAQHKVHHAATVTLTMKNIAMSYPAADYYGHPREAKIHSHRFLDDIHSFIVGMCLRFPIALGIIAGHPVMIEKGPIGGITFESGLVIASRDCVAADYIGARLLGIERVKHIDDAARLGLGKASLDAIAFPGLSVDEALRIFNEKKEAVIAGSRSR